jgi:hypothetical protein
VDFRILGPLEVTDQGRELPLAGSKPRAVLAILLLHANEVVSSERLIDALWGDEPPPRKGEPFDLAVNGWVADYPDPMTFLDLLDGRTIAPDNNLNYAYFEMPASTAGWIQRTGCRPPARELALGRLDAQVARHAAVANERQHDFFSERIGCQVFNPVYGMNLGALCMRGASRE